MSKARGLADLGNVYDDGALSNRNLIINSAMQVAQRGTSFTADNIYTLDRWSSGDGTGGTPARTLSQETFTLGQTDVPNAHYYLRHNQTAASTNGNSSLVQKIEDITRFDGQTITLSFYAKADAAMDIDVRLIQDFGTGGSPSSDVTLTETVSIGTSWTRYTVTKTLGSLSGKTLGSDGVHTSFLSLNIEFQPTSTFTFDATLFQLEYGDTATPFEHRSYGDELARCQRYYYRKTGTVVVLAIAQATASDTARFPLRLVPTMRAAPTLSISNVSDFRIRNATGASKTFTTMTLLASGNQDVDIEIGGASTLAAGDAAQFRSNSTSAFLDLDAEL